jgi:hypothetical protein
MKIVFAYCLLLLAFYQIDCTTFNVSNESELNDALIQVIHNSFYLIFSLHIIHAIEFL